MKPGDIYDRNGLLVATSFSDSLEQFKNVYEKPTTPPTGDEMPVAVLPEIDTSNPLLAEWDTPYATPPFDKIEISHYEPAFDAAIAVSRAEIEANLGKGVFTPNFESEAARINLLEMLG